MFSPPYIHGAVTGPRTVNHMVAASRKLPVRQLPSILGNRQNRAEAEGQGGHWYPNFEAGEFRRVGTNLEWLLGDVDLEL